MTGLRRYVRPAPVAAQRHEPDGPAPRCDLCATDLTDRHGHVVSLDDRALRCVCRPCSLLFTPAGAGGGRIRAVPDRYLTDPAHPITDDDWDLLQIPVLPVFLFVNSDLDRVVACYPSPAGATESLLDLDGWTRLQQRYPLLQTPVADVEAVYVTRGDDGLAAYPGPDRRLLRDGGHAPVELARAARRRRGSPGHRRVRAGSARTQPAAASRAGLRPRHSLIRCTRPGDPLGPGGHKCPVPPVIAL